MRSCRLISVPTCVRSTFLNGHIFMNIRVFYPFGEEVFSDEAPAIFMISNMRSVTESELDATKATLRNLP